MKFIAACALSLAFGVFADSEKVGTITIHIAKHLFHTDLQADFDLALEGIAEAFQVTISNPELRAKNDGYLYSASARLNNPQSPHHSVILTNKNGVPFKRADLIQQMVNAFISKFIKENKQLNYRSHITQKGTLFIVALSPSLTFKTAPNFDGSKTITFTTLYPLLELSSHIRSAASGIAKALNVQQELSFEGDSIILIIQSPANKNFMNTPQLASFCSKSEYFYDDLFFIQDFITIILEELNMDTSQSAFVGYRNLSVWQNIACYFGCNEEPDEAPYVLHLMPKTNHHF